MFRALILTHAGLVVLAIVAMAVTEPDQSAPSIFESSAGHAVFVGLGLLLVSWWLVRSERLNLGIALYVALTVGVALTPLSMPADEAQVGMVASLILPIMIAATAWRWRVAAWVSAAIIGAGVALAATSNLAPAQTATASALLCVTAVAGGLTVVLRLHFEALQRQHSERGAAHSRDVEAALDRYRGLFSVVGDAIMVADSRGKFLDVNDGTCRQLGYSREALLAMNIADIATTPPEGVRTTMMRVMSQGHALMETTHIAKGGRVVPMELSITKIEYEGQIAFLSVGRDISERLNAESERNRLEMQLMHAVKMESIGRLASGVAHDLNNVLTAIGGNLELARDVLAEGDRDAATEFLDNVQLAADSAAGLTRQLLGFSKKQVVAPRDFDPGELVGRLSRLLDRLITKAVKVRISIADKIGTVNADPGLIEQVIVNLAVNARDAMPDGGTLQIDVSNVFLDETYRQRHPDAKPGPYVLMSVTDTGSGIAPEVLPHIFEPFFTTKSTDRGTGLGLATSYGAIKQSGGTIQVHSEVGQGTTFKVYLPRIDKAADALVQLDVKAPLPRGKETILVVEDDPPCRMLAVHVLNNLGYQVVEASDGAMALEVAKRHEGSIDLMLTDMVMPGLSGSQVADALHELRPDLKVVYTSGYPENIIASRVGANTLYLGKPYTMVALAGKIREALGPAIAA